MATAVTPPPVAPVRPRRVPVWEHVPRALPERGLSRAAVAVALALTLAGAAYRFVAPGGLWLDEALSVNIAKLPLSQLFGALVWDGSPPLYYVILHFWMLVFGQGDVAVRALSGACSVALLPLMWMAGKRVAGRRGAWSALLLAATSPWAIYYGSYTRMYSMMALEALLFFLALRRAMEAPTKGRLVLIGALTAVLMYTHYWDLYLVGVAGLWALWRTWTEGRWGTLQPGAAPGAAVRVLWSLIAGGACFIPWSPVFVFQALHTGTPWTSPPGPQDLLQVFGDFAGVGPWSVLLAFLFFALVALAFFGHPGTRSTSVVLDVHPQPRSRFLGALAVGTLGVAVVAGAVTGAAFDQRYIAVVFPFFVLVCALGLGAFSSRRMAAGVLAVACVAGLLAGRQWSSQPRTQAVQVAAVLNAEAKPGDMVVYCPDQLGPAVDRLLKVPDVTELTFPRMYGPQRIDWVDYLAYIRQTHVGTFARDVENKLAPGSTLWLVYRDGYQGFGSDCGQLRSWFAQALPGMQTVVQADAAGYYEYENLVAFPG